jgi:hypothetical protein
LRGPYRRRSSRGIQSPFTWHTLQHMDAAILEAQTRPGHQILGRARYERLLAVRKGTNSRPDMNGNPADVATRELDFAGVHSGAYENAKVSRHLLNAQRTAHRTSRSIKRRKEPSPAVFTSRPRKVASSLRTSA